jgi:hypothetical protein
MRRLFALVACLATLGGLIIYSQAGQAADNKPCNNNSEQCMISAATTYLDALVSHDTSHIRVAPDVKRTEEGGITAYTHTTQTGTVQTGAADIRKSLSIPTFDESIIDRRDTRWFVDKPNHEAIAFYILDVGAEPNLPTLLPFVRPTEPTGTVHLSERFKVQNGLITQIEAIFNVSSGPGHACETDNWPPTPTSPVCTSLVDPFPPL